MGEKSVTNCAEHGAGFETFICEHLAQNPRQRWYSAEVSDENPWPDAWCRSCNLVFELEGEWNESNARTASTFTVKGPSISLLSPASAVAGGAPFTLTVTGSNFVSGSTVLWGATALATTYGSPASLTAAVTSAQLASSGSPKVTVKNSSAASSSASTFTVTAH